MNDEQPPCTGHAYFAVLRRQSRRASSGVESYQGTGTSGDWLTYSGSYRSDRYSALAQIAADNVARLRVAWIYQCGDGSLEATPVVANGLIYLTCPPASVVALSPQSGRPLWKWSRTLARDVTTIGFGRTNRAIAVLDDKVYIGTLDGYLVALDAQSGVER